MQEPNTSLASGTSINADIYGIGGITPRQSQSITHNIAGPSRSLTRSNSQTSQSTSPARIIPDSNPATTHKIKCQHTGLTSLDNTDGFDGNCRSEGCKAVDKMYTYQNEYPPLPARHPDHHYNPAEAFCIASPSISTLEVPNTSAATQVITSQPTRRPSQLSMMGTDMIDTPAAKDSNRDQNSAYLANRCNRTQSIAAAKNQATHASSIASNSVLAYCGEEQAHSNAIGLDSIRTDGVEGDNGDYGRYANCETSATYPCQIPMRQFELQQLPSHEASRRSHNFYHSFSSRGAFELRPGESVVVIQQQTKHEGQYYHADASNVDMHQSTENAKVNLISSHERLSVTELPDRDIQHGVEYRKENREDSQPSKFNPWSSHFSQLHQDHYRQHLLQSNCLESKDPSETIYSEGKRSTLQIPSSRETTCRSSLAIGNTTKSSDLSDVPVTITSAREAPAKMLTKAFLSDREEFLKLQACEPIIEYTSYKTSPSLAFTSGAPHHAEIASVKSSGSLINQHGREYSDSLLRGTPRQDFDDMRYNPLRSHPVQARIGSRPIHSRSTSYSSVQQKHTPAKNIHTVSSHQDLQQYRRLEKSPSQPNMIGSSTSVSSKRLPAMAKGDRENIITRTLTPLKGHSFLHRSDGKKPKKSLSMTPLTAGRAPKEVTCGEKIDAVTDSVRSSSHRPRDLWKREQSTDGGAHLSRSTTTSKRVKDLHRRACVSPLKISFPNELVGDVAVPIYPGSDSTISSRLYYSCNEDTMNNDSVMTLPSGGKHSMDGMLSFSNKSSPLLSEYESSSDVPTSDEEEVQICEAKIESARRVRHRRVNAVEIKQIDIKPRLPPTPPMHPIQAPISPAHRFIPHSIPRRLQKRNMDALNRFMIRRSPSDPVHTPLTPPEEGQLSHSASNSSFPRRPVLRHGFAFRHSHSCPSSNVNSPSMPSLPEAEVNQMREHMRSASSSDSNQSSWSQGSDDSLNTFVDLKDASFNFN
ncbi:hypothetical protein AAP_05537 [Ascosphaera apis ARSEF 7405]|uniref:Uncharacterized protein n=1 Tax=Ascosphaera apis ARSEF 7405 TaxID=392613 RepID=A0A167VJM9_9EURO|nr:hypothetical protein AAP_05537 [Ascosphaera apis ARSEF 7405]